MSKFFGMFPTPPPIAARSRVIDLKARLDWGEPALTIIDTRDRAAFNHSHILGAISIPLSELVNRTVGTLEQARDIYVYGETDDETGISATKLREAGFVNVSEIRGGLAAWKAVGYPVESIATVA